MPTYDAEKCKELIESTALGVHCGLLGDNDTQTRLAEMLLAATQEVERLTRERDEAVRSALAETIVSMKHEREANDAIALVAGERDAAHAEIERLRGLVGETTYVAERTGALTDSDRQDLAVIRHAAGVEGKGE